MGQQHHVRLTDQFGADGRFMLVDIQPRATQLGPFQHFDQGVFIDHLAAGGVDDDRVRLQQG